ncbi:U1 small nuclear ribonucleoprotein [Plectosphaerella cucumerina]|uniref:U1 small nuclear ribonucleoprotein n=1 Tax=Plectosphaerella cucumerina TaxID=40658 RepID=A0A8K0T8E5_9PEZI|nr:U1 small nuclear ribonucleoprotein [Plectosphaerella cucumerina]
MTDKLPPNLLALFAPRPPLRWVPPTDQAPEKRKTAAVSGLASFLPALEEYKQTDVYVPTESWLQMKDRKKLEAQKAKLPGAMDKVVAAEYKPAEDPNIRGDPFKTLIVARLSYEANEQDLEREFGRFGNIERIRIVTDTHAHEKSKEKKRKPHRGYAFVVYERERDARDTWPSGLPVLLLRTRLMWPSSLPVSQRCLPPSPSNASHAALDSLDGVRIKDRRIKVDIERGRTVKGWRPRRFGGGLGGRGYTKALPARPMGGPGGFGGGFRGGFRGGFDGGRGRGGFRGGFGGRGGGFRGGGDFGSRDRGPPNGFPRDAPSGPGGPGFGGRGGFDRDRGFDRGSDRGGDRGSDRGGRPPYDDRSGGGRDRFGDRDRDGGRRTGSNMEPIRPRGEGGYREDRGRDRERDRDRDHRDFDRPRDDDSRKRGYDGGGYEDPRKLRRY